MKAGLLIVVLTCPAAERSDHRFLHPRVGCSGPRGDCVPLRIKASKWENRVWMRGCGCNSALGEDQNITTHKRHGLTDGFAADTWRAQFAPCNNPHRTADCVAASLAQPLSALQHLSQQWLQVIQQEAANEIIVEHLWCFKIPKHVSCSIVCEQWQDSSTSFLISEHQGLSWQTRWTSTDSVLKCTT